MLGMDEPHVKKSPCSYCGNAPVNHFFYFVESFIHFTFESHFKRLVSVLPSFVRHITDGTPRILFNTLVFLRLAKFSNDISKARTFRSRIIWDEAVKRGILMEQVIFLNKPLDYYRAKMNGSFFYFESIPIKPEFLDANEDWDDKVVMKREFKNTTSLCRIILNFRVFHFLVTLS